MTSEYDNALTSRAEQIEQLARVTSKIEHIVLRYAIMVLDGSSPNNSLPYPLFRVDSLEKFCERRCLFDGIGYALGSGGRVLRKLRQRGLVSYACTDRTRGIYRMDAVQLDLKLYERKGATA